MSGLEVVGVVLAAFPLAIEALEVYRRAHRRLKLFEPRYLRCIHDLKIIHASFKSYLRQAIVPFIDDDTKMDDLLSNPRGGGWKKKEIIDILQRQLGEDYELFLECIRGVVEAMDTLNQELDSAKAQKSLQTPLPKLIFGIKFSMRETDRTNLFQVLERYNSQLGILLDINSKEKIPAQRSTRSFSRSTLCNFWIHANAVFKAIASKWTCDCQEKHITKLLLEHRTSESNELNMLVATRSLSCWNIQKALITGNYATQTQSARTSTAPTNTPVIHQPDHRKSMPMRSALKKSNTSGQRPKSKNKAIQMTMPSSVPSDAEIKISNLCYSLNQKSDGYCGYLTEEDYKYFVYRASNYQTGSFNSISLDQILRIKASPPPSRYQRYALSLTLASSFLQLLDTPWLPEPWKKSDIIFIGDEKTPNNFLVDQPHLNREVIAQSTPEINSQQTPSIAKVASNEGSIVRIFRPLELLGIILLELCFGQLLEDQQCRQDLPSGNDEMQKHGFDYLAARKWSLEVSEEAGFDFDDAIKWCLDGHRNATADSWRGEMFRQVVQPLERCYKQLSERRM
ncbi:hypothetical protein M426DRAFT_265320 [Hypoxylon sp. CI-4A]|nr:hypothetical protein M426DRAFT_265320 [Hypoxylon sp. CI-4A]